VKRYLILWAQLPRVSWQRHLPQADGTGTRTRRRNGCHHSYRLDWFSTVTGADLILVMKDGRIAQAGTHGSLLAAGGLYAELYSIQANAYAPTNA
jgi:hypothetical protein